MGLVVRVSVWVWLCEFLYGCGLWEFLCLLWLWGLLFEFSSGNFCVSVTSSFLSEDEMQGHDIRVMTSFLCQSLI